MQISPVFECAPCPASPSNFFSLVITLKVKCWSFFILHLISVTANPSFAWVGQKQLSCHRGDSLVAFPTVTINSPVPPLFAQLNQGLNAWSGGRTHTGPFDTNKACWHMGQEMQNSFLRMVCLTFEANCHFLSWLPIYQGN